MGWKSHDLPSKSCNKGWKLWHRCGTDSVYIKHVNIDEEIIIPSSLLQKLVAEDIRSKRIEDLESTNDKSILNL